MANKYLEKIAKDHMVKGWISPAWQENAIAKDHGKEGLKGAGANVGKHVVGATRSGVRGFAHSLVGGAVGMVGGAAVSALSKGKINASRAKDAGTMAGSAIGTIHGTQKSLRNQAAEAHEKYGKK